MMVKKKISPIHLLASSLRNCLMKIMCIEAKFRGWDIGEMQIDFCRKMKSDVPRKKEFYSRNFHTI